MLAAKRLTEQVCKEYAAAINAAEGNEVFAVSRSENKLYVYSLDGEKLFEENIAKKPVDSILFENRIFIFTTEYG